MKLFYPESVKKSRSFTCLIMAGLFLLVVDRIPAQVADSAQVRPEVRTHTPRKATLYSIILPGLGQVYNRKYWKVPIIYGAGGAFAYFMSYNQLKYKKFRAAISDPNSGPKVLIDGRSYNQDILPRGRDYYRRNRDLSVIGLGAIYFLNVVDAMIDASFYYYDVSDDLSLRVQPTLIESQGLMSAVGIQVHIGF